MAATKAKADRASVYIGGRSYEHLAALAEKVDVTIPELARRALIVYATLHDSGALQQDESGMSYKLDVLVPGEKNPRPFVFAG